MRDVTLAGLLHDIGHACFSHLFDRLLIPKIQPGIKWEHEDASEMLIDYLIDEQYIDLEPVSVRRIKRLIKGERGGDSKGWLFDIVANKRNAIDVDKFDYLARDAYQIGVRSVYYDFDRLIKTSRVIDNEICFNIKNSYSLYSLFASRYKMFKQVYYHRVVQAIDFMVLEALELANPLFHFEEAINDPKAYIKLTDNLLFQIQHSKKAELKESKAILERIGRRDLYRFASEVLLEDGNPHLRDEFNAQDIVNYQKGS